MKAIPSLIFLIMIITSCSNSNISLDNKQLFDLNWKYNYGKNDLAFQTNFDDQDWRELDLPHDWSNDEFMPEIHIKSDKETITEGTAWYRKHFQVPPNWIKKNIYLGFEGISPKSKLYINGVQVEKFQLNNNEISLLHLNTYLNFHGDNVIAILVEETRRTNNLWKKGTGIYNHVWLFLSGS
ncbi:sugar-binding domain-containing protein [Mangrovimonas futianensis]|uniref:sugar-binding domain-containing protein n=1 Tax=Mangrovimonas futianensis TaxID=2895523 RepID=UPI001E405769|nr:sugar-binding domain-containing protein [Mangrovimonas futianensis]MCF1195933.1 beta galactosidase jelly roll domain-containing protein [Mangrovimonas futianensis]